MTDWPTDSLKAHFDALRAADHAQFKERFEAQERALHISSKERRTLTAKVAELERMIGILQEAKSRAEGRGGGISAVYGWILAAIVALTAIMREIIK